MYFFTVKAAFFLNIEHKISHYIDQTICGAYDIYLLYKQVELLLTYLSNSDVYTSIY